MNMFTISPNLLQAIPAGGSGQFLTTIVMFGLIFLIFYFLIIRPQNKRQKETKEMLEQIKKGDKIQTIGGICGSIASVKEQTVIVQVDSNCSMEFLRSAIAQVITPEDKKGEGKKTEGKAKDKQSKDGQAKASKKLSDGGSDGSAEASE